MMRPTSKISVCLVLSGLGLMLTCSNAVWPQEAKKISPKVKELKAKRLEVLEAARDDVTNMQRGARFEFEDMREVSGVTFAARLEDAKTKEERIAVCEKEVKQAELLLSYATARRQATGGRARASKLDELMFQAYLLEIQITLGNATANE